MLINPYAFGSYTPTDTDAAAYIAAVEAADGSTLESGVRKAYDDFVIGCKTDGIWTAIKASCILAGARTLSGALVPLVGTAPTNNNFVSGDYERKTGLKGDASSKWLNSNRANNADPINSKHVSIYVTQAGLVETSKGFIGASPAPTNGGVVLGTSTSATSIGTRLHTNTGTVTNNAYGTGFVGIQRSSSAQYILRSIGTSRTIPVSSTSQTTASIGVFSYDSGVSKSSDRFAFYSIGESLSLALLDSRVTTLINAIAAAIP